MEILDEAIHCCERIRFFSITVMSMIPFSLFVIVTDYSLAFSSVEESIFESMVPFLIRTTKFPNDYFDDRSTRKDFSVSVKKMRFIRVGYHTNSFSKSKSGYIYISTHHPLGRLKNPEGSFPPFPHGTSTENSSTIGTHTFSYPDRSRSQLHGGHQDTQRSPRPSGGGDLAFSEDSREIPCREQPRHFFPSVRNPASHPRMHGPFHYDRAIMRRQMFTGKPGILLLCRHCQGTDNPSHRL